MSEADCQKALVYMRSLLELLFREIHEKPFGSVFLDDQEPRGNIQKLSGISRNLCEMPVYSEQLWNTGPGGLIKSCFSNLFGALQSEKCFRQKVLALEGFLVPKIA